MSKIRNLPETTTLDDADLLYTVDVSEGPNGGRKITKENLKTSIAQSPTEIKSAYESNADTNAFTDAEKSKLAGVETGATADQDSSEVPYDNTISGLSATNVKTALDEIAVESQADFRPSIVSGQILHYTGGTARFDDTFFQLVAGDILLAPNITLGEVYVDLDGIVKQTGSGVTAPPLTIVFARFSTDLNNIISLTDERVKNTQNLVRGDTSNVRDVRAGAAASAGSSGRLSDAEHKHNILTAAPSTQTPNQANSEGVAPELARADHIHNIPTAAPSSILTPSSTNAEGSGTAFAKDTHTHAIAVGVDADVSTITPNATPASGAIDKFARAGHTHGIATAAAIELTDTTNAEGNASSFARSNHTHAHGNRGGGTLHATATTSSNGFMSSADKTKLDAMVFGFLAYSNNSNQSTTQNNTAFSAITLDTDQSSFPNGLLTKVNATQFRTDFTGYIRVSLKIRAQNTSSNDVAWRAVVLRGGTPITHTEVRSNGKTNADRYNSAAGTFLIPCTNGDLYTFGFSNAENATDTITIYASGASCSIEALYKTA